MAYAPEYDFFLRVARGLVPGHHAVQKFGQNDSIASGTPEDIIIEGGDYAGFTTAAETINVVSNNVNDDASPAGSGCRTVTVYGLDASWDEQSEDVDLNGTTNVATANTYIRMNRMISIDSQTRTNPNTGIITAVGATSAAEYARIAAGEGQTLQAVYTVPNAHTGWIVSYYFSLIKPSSTAGIEMQLWVGQESKPFVMKHVTGSDRYGGLPWQFPFAEGAIECPAKTDIKMRCDSSATVNVMAGFNIILIDD